MEERTEIAERVELAKNFVKNGYMCLTIDCERCSSITGCDCLKADIKLWCDSVLEFDKWTAEHSSHIEELADYFFEHDTENYFTGEKYEEAYEKIKALCRLAYEHK